MSNLSYDIKISKPSTTITIEIVGSIKNTIKKFSFDSKESIYGEIINSYVVLRNHITLTIPYIEKTDRDKLFNLWKDNTTVEIKSNINDIYMATFIDEAFGLEETFTQSDGTVYYSGSLNLIA